MTDRSRQERVAIAAEQRALEVRGGEVDKVTVQPFRTSDEWDYFVEVRGTTDGRRWILSGYANPDGTTSITSTSPLDPFENL